MSNPIVLPSTVSELREVIRAAIVHFQGSPVKNENKLNETLAISLGFGNYDQLSVLLDSAPVEDDVETSVIEFDSRGGQQIIIDGVRMDTELVHKEIVDYMVSDREDRISDLRMFIGEAQRDPDRSHDVYLMQEDLDYLMSSNDEYVLENYGTNGFLAADVDPEEFNDACEKMKSSAKAYYSGKVHTLGKFGLKLDVSSYYSGDEIEGVYEGEIALIHKNCLGDDALPVGIPVQKYEGEILDGFIAAYIVNGEYVPIEFNDASATMMNKAVKEGESFHFPLIDDDWRLTVGGEDVVERIDGDYFDHLLDILKTDRYTDHEIEHYIYHLLDLGLYVDLLTFVEYLVMKGKKYFAGILSVQLYDTGCPFADDAKYAEYLEIAGQDDRIFDANPEDGSNVNVNYCGGWVAGHKPAHAYNWFRKTFHYDTSSSIENIRYGYLIKDGENLLYSDTKKPNSTPITTIL